MSEENEREEYERKYIEEAVEERREFAFFFFFLMIKPTAELPGEKQAEFPFMKLLGINCPFLPVS